MAKYLTNHRVPSKVNSFTPQRGSKFKDKCPQRPPQPKHSDITARIAGKDLGEMVHIWKEVAASEVRVNLIAALKNKNLGFNEVESFGLASSIA